jgi:phosphate/sulfate permease
MPTLQPYHGQTRDVYLWHYVPNIAAAIAFAVLFALATAVHAWKMIKTAMWFCAPFIAGGICASCPALISPEICH